MPVGAYRKILASSLLLCSLSSVAQPPDSSRFEQSDIDDSLSSGSKITLSDDEKSVAKQFKLTEQDWRKYKQLKKGPWGYWAPDLDPLTMLGMAARDQRERQRYARIWMEVETEKVEQMLAFERARTQAAIELHGDMKRIENGPWIEKWERERRRVTTVINYFVDADCLEDCRKVSQQVLSSISDKSKLDIYFPTTATEEDINRWATFNEIDPVVVASRRITLNFDNGKSSKLDVDILDLPQVRVVNRDTGEVQASW